jgi:Zn-dependent alcohol dehydrogenase
MRAAICREFGQPFTLEDVSLAPPGADEVVVRLAAVSICHSDIVFADGGWGGALPAIYGHEAAGIVETVGGSIDDITPGDHVVVTMVRSCGTCPCCARGLRGCCVHDFGKGAGVKLRDSSGQAVAQGLKTAAFAERTAVHRSQIVKIDPDLPFDVAAVLACGVITGYGAVTRSAAMRPGADVVVVGAGGVGLNCIQAARLGDAKTIVAIDRAASRLDFARTFGATALVDASEDDSVQAVLDLTAGRGADYVFVAVGAKAAIETAFSMLAPGGAAVLVGIPENGVSTTFDPVTLASGSCRIIGSKLGDVDIDQDIPTLINLYREGRVKLDELITDRFRFDAINEAMAMARSGGGLKTVIEFGAP